MESGRQLTNILYAINDLIVPLSNNRSNNLKYIELLIPSLLKNLVYKMLLQT